MSIANYFDIGACSPGAIDPESALFMDNSCFQNGLVSGFHLIFIVTLLIILLANRSRTDTTNSTASPGSFLEWICLLSTSGLSLFTLGLALFLWVAERHPPLLQCIFFLVQGLAWLCLAFTVKIHKRPEFAKLVRVWWVASFVLGTHAAIAAIFNVVNNQRVTLSTMLSLASWLAYSLLLLCTFVKGQSKGPRSEEEPLLAPSDAEKVSPFATAGILSRVSFGWLNPLLASGFRSPLELGDIPRLGKTDSAEENLEKFAQALREQESGGKPFSVFWALAACFWKPMAANGLFALGKSITVSLGPVVLKTFIDYTGGKRLFKYEGVVLVVALFSAKALESVSQRQWYFGSRRVGLQVRSALMAYIYRKDLRLANAGTSRTLLFGYAWN